MAEYNHHIRLGYRIIYPDTTMVLVSDTIEVATLKLVNDYIWWLHWWFTQTSTWPLTKQKIAVDDSAPSLCRQKQASFGMFSWVWVKIETMATLMFECEGLMAQQKLIKVMVSSWKVYLYINYHICNVATNCQVKKGEFKQRALQSLPITTRISIFLVGDTYKPASFATIASWEDNPNDTNLSFPRPTWVDPHGHGERGIVDSDWRPWSWWMVDGEIHGPYCKGNDPLHKTTHWWTMIMGGRVNDDYFTSFKKGFSCGLGGWWKFDFMNWQREKILQC